MLDIGRDAMTTALPERVSIVSAMLRPGRPRSGRSWVTGYLIRTGGAAGPALSFSRGTAYDSGSRSGAAARSGEPGAPVRRAVRRLDPVRDGGRLLRRPPPHRMD